MPNTAAKNARKYKRQSKKLYKKRRWEIKKDRRAQEAAAAAGDVPIVHIEEENGAAAAAAAEVPGVHRDEENGAAAAAEVPGVHREEENGAANNDALTNPELANTCTSTSKQKREPQKRTLEDAATLSESHPSHEVGDESNVVEKSEVLPSLASGAKALEDAYNSLEGVTCDKAKEGMYLFPRFKFPQKAIEAAEAARNLPDAFYVNRLLKTINIVIVPGSNLGQVRGTWYIDIELTVLLHEEKFPAIITRLADFHQAFMAEFHD